MAAGNKHLAYKNVLNGLEVESPGSKFAFYFGFLERAAERFSIPADVDTLGECEQCGSPSNNSVCAFCRLIERAAVPTQSVDVALTKPGGTT